MMLAPDGDLEDVIVTIYLCVIFVCKISDSSKYINEGCNEDTATVLNLLYLFIRAFDLADLNQCLNIIQSIRDEYLEEFRFLLSSIEYYVPSKTGN